MENVIEKLRELIGEGYEGGTEDETYESVNSLIKAYRPVGYCAEHVHDTFSDGGR